MLAFKENFLHFNLSTVFVIVYFTTVELQFVLVFGSLSQSSSQQLSARCFGNFCDEFNTSS